MSATATKNLTVVTGRPSERVKDRLHGLDWLRAGAAVLVVLLHAGVPYLTHRMPGLVWSAESRQRSAAVNLCCWWIDGFIMPLFFLMAGFFAARLFKQRGAKAFLKHRLARIGGPLLFGIVVILPMDLYAWLLGWINAGIISSVKLRSLKIDSQLSEGLWGVAHLWFLEYVLVYCLAAWLLHHVVVGIRTWTQTSVTTFYRIPKSLAGAIQTLRPLLRQALPFGNLALLAGAALGGWMLWRQPRIVIGFRHDWIPFWENLVYYSVPFLIGWLWESRSARAEPTRWESITRLLAATLVFAVLWPRLLQHLSHETIPVSDPMLPFLFAWFSLLMACGLFGLSLSLRFERTSAVISYLAQASFWIYLFHHPLVGLTHVDLAFVDLPGLGEWLLSGGMTLGICLLSYEVAVRRTWLGELLNGYRDGARPAEKIPQPAAASTPEERRAA